MTGRMVAGLLAAWLDQALPPGAFAWHCRRSVGDAAISHLSHEHGENRIGSLGTVSDNGDGERGEADDPKRSGSGDEPGMKLQSLTIFFESLNTIDTEDLAVTEFLERQTLELSNFEGALWTGTGEVLGRLKRQDVQSKCD